MVILMKTILQSKKLSVFIVLVAFIVIFTNVIIHKYLSTNLYISKKSGSTLLKSLTIENHEILFNPLENEYKISLSSEETSLSIIAEPEDKSATVKIFNNDDLTNHDAIYIYVTSKDHNIRKYTINYSNQTALQYFNERVDDCTKMASNYCLKFFNLRNNNYDYYLLFSYDTLTTDGYPNTNIISLNDKQIFRKKIVDAEFHNFNIIDNKVIFTYNSVKEPNKISLFGVDLQGNVVLDKTIINNNYKNLYIYDLTISPTKIKLKTRLPNTTKENVCKLNDNSIAEARYTINYNNSKFEEPTLDSQITVKEFKILMNINCEKK